jgi:outer membrane protein assembly factor BamB
VVLDLLKQRNVQAILCGHGHSNRKLSFEGIPGVMGRSNVRAKQPAGGYNIVEVDGSELRFAERRPQQETLPPWHGLKMEQRDYRNQTNQYARPDFSVNQRYPDVRPRWWECTGYTIASTPALWHEMAIVGDASGAVYGFDARTGEKKWTYKTKSAVYSTPAVTGELVIVPSTDGSIHALKAKTGKLAWRYKTKRPIVASPAVAGDLVYIGSSEGKMRALRNDTGKLVWEHEGVRGFIETRPLVYEEKVIFGAWDQHLYALDAASGQLAWRWTGDRPGTLLSPAACWPVAAAGQVFIVAPDRQMTAIEAESGRQIWRTGKYQVRESIGLSEDASRVYVRTMNDHFHAFATGKLEPEEVWGRNAGFGYDINSGMLVEKEGVVFYGTKNGLLLALNGATGEILWQHKLGTGVMNTVLPISKRFVLVTDFDGNVALIENSRVNSTR